MKLPIILPLPPAINATYKTTRKGGFYKSTEAKDWEQESLWLLMKHPKALHKLTVPVYVGLSYFLSRDRDIDSMIKITLDILQKSGHVKNDNLIEHLNVKKFTDKKNPRVEIELMAL